MTLDEIEAALRQHHDAAQRVIDTFRGQHYPPNRADARKALKALQETVKQEYNRRKRMTGLEAEVYGPSIHYLFVELQGVRVGAIPGPEWLIRLHSAQREISWAIDHRIAPRR